MLSTLLMAIISTIIIGAIVVIILNLLLSSKDSHDDDNQSRDTITTAVETKSVSEEKQETIDDIVSTEEETQREEPLFVEESVDLLKDSYVSDNTDLKTEESVGKINESKDNIVDDISEVSEELIFKEVIEPIASSFEDRPDNQEEIREFIQEAKEIENQLIDLDDTLDQQINDQQINDQQIDAILKEEIEKEGHVKTDDNEDFWNLDETQNLLHLNKSRPRKSKSRPSVKVVFNDESDGKGAEQPPPEESVTEDPVSKNAKQLVDNLFENLQEEVNQFKNRLEESPEKESEDLNVEESDVATQEISIEKSDDSYEELAPASGEYKKFDEFSDCFRTERHEFSRNVRQTTSVKTYEITLDDSLPMNEQTINDMLKEFADNSSKTEVFEEKYAKVTEIQSIEVKREDKREVLSQFNNETVTHSKSFSERSLSSSSLSKMSLEDLDVSLRSSKSRLSETIDNVTKPLRSSPTLFRRSMIEKSSEEADDENNGIEGQKRNQIPIFGTTQSLLMSEMKEKQFRKSLRSTSDVSAPDTKKVSDL